MIEQKEWAYVNKLFNVDLIEDSDGIVRHSQPVFNEKLGGIDILLKDAYKHPCESIYFDPEYF